MFSSPKRRATRQRSGYTVSGTKTGSEAKIVHTHVYNVQSPNLILSFDNCIADVVPQFTEDIGMAAIGGYIKVEESAKISYTIKVLDSITGTILTENDKTTELPQESWSKFGTYVQFDNPKLYETVSLKGTVSLAAHTTCLGKVHFLGINVDLVTAYESSSVAENFGENIKEDFGKKTHLSSPEVYYWNHEAPFAITSIVTEGRVEATSDVGDQLVLKACNRCARFLPIDLLDERKQLGFGNHCVKRAPCNHKAFSRFAIENSADLDRIDSNLQDKISGESDTILAYYGFQLECKACKKFHVNAPLNPRRNTTQRREDSLRRRAIEKLVRTLLEIDWIFYKFRRQEDSEESDIHILEESDTYTPEEFDTYIWNRFDRKCFACGKSLPNVGDMELDHTLPLAYLWPLDETATCLCGTCNASKSAKFPFEFENYRETGKLERLAELTGINKTLLLQEEKEINKAVVEKLKNRIEWFFDDFLSEPDYQEIKEGKKVADLIVASIQRVLDECNTSLNLVQAYQERTGGPPTTITLSIQQSWGY